MASAIFTPEIITEDAIFIVMFVHQVEVDVKIEPVLHKTHGQLVRPLSVLNEIMNCNKYQNIPIK